jgi:uncharacterized alkaline shock family protein YloU
MGAQAAGGAGDAAPPAAPWDPAGGDLAVARAAAAAARGVPGVADVTPGRFAAAATYGPGEVVRGVAVRRRPGGWAVEVHLRAVYAPARPLPALADRVRRAVGAAVAALGGGPAGPIDVAVDDLEVGEPPERQPERRVGHQHQDDPASGRGEA